MVKKLNLLSYVIKKYKKDAPNIIMKSLNYYKLVTLNIYSSWLKENKISPWI